jgi:two-component system chemotaxis sensor kinase CheA
MDSHKECYREEAYELLGELENALMELEEAPDDRDLIDRVFRSMHTIKGSGSMFGFDEIACFTHEIETIYELVRDGRIRVDKSLVGLTLSACDQIKKMVDGEKLDKENAQTILAGFRQILKESFGDGVPESLTDLSMGHNDGGTTEPAGIDPDNESLLKYYRIRFRPGPDLFSTGTNPLALLDELRGLGECRVTALTDNIPPLEDLDPESCLLGWDVVLGTEREIDAVRDVFIFVEDNCDIRVEELHWQGADDQTRLGDILIERGDLTPEDLTAVLVKQKLIGEMLQESGAAETCVIESALAEQQQARLVQRDRQDRQLASSVRVPAEKLDILVALVGELVTVQASLSRKAANEEDAEWLSISEKVERLTTELRDHTMDIRMLPIGTTFNKFKRLARDLSNDLGKEVALVTEGGETELDKTVIERLNDPLVHIIRNSIDHGIESPETREKQGKPRQGRITLSAVHSGAHVLIRVSDDGRGIDPEMIRAKAIQRGIIAPDEELTEKELFSLVFAPGFSTAEKVTDVSGRGVGMDVVKRGIENLRGSIELDSRLGQGTIVTLKLPLTLAIIDGLLVEIGGTSFVMPLSSVEECKELTREDLKRANGRNLLTIRDEIVPFVPLREMLGLDGTRPVIEQIVITDMDGFRMGFVVDQIVGEHQTVIKNLGKTYKDARGFSGATILADGTVALILDVGGLSEIAREEERLR